jgi:hypothetical protein
MVKIDYKKLKRCYALARLIKKHMVDHFRMIRILIKIVSRSP